MSQLRIATAQSPVGEDVAANAEEIKSLIRKAARAGAGLVHFPECALSGYAKRHIGDWGEVRWDGLDHELQSIQQVCADFGIAAAVGANHRRGDGERPYNAVHIIDANGARIERYDKRFCSHTEIQDWYSAGHHPSVVEVNGITLGVLICIEIQFPELFQEYERLGVDCVLFSALSDSEMFAVQAQGHAACNNYWISFSVPYNMGGGPTARMIGPDGTVVGVCGDNRPGLTVNTIDPEDPAWDIPCKRARPWRRLARSGAIYGRVSR